MLPATYRTLLRIPGATPFFLTAAIGRVGIAMTGLGIVWLVHGQTGSYALAGLVTGAFAVAGAVVSPLLARPVDRYGQTRTLPPMLLVHAAGVVLLLGSVTGGAPRWIMVAAGTLTGATVPQLGALSSARWTALLDEDGDGSLDSALDSAFALESFSNSAAYLAGPALVSVVAAAGRPAWGTVAAAVLVVGGGLCFAAQRRTAPPLAFAPTRTPASAPTRTPASAPTPAPTPARARFSLRVAALIGANLAIGGFFGAMQVSVTAFAVAGGAAGSAAWLFALANGAGLFVVWLYGMRRWTATPRTQLLSAAAALALAALPMLAGNRMVVAAGVVLTGLPIPIVLAMCSLLVAAAVPRTILTQALTWLGSAGAVGSAAAAALAGAAVDLRGVQAGFLLGAACTVAVAVFAWAATVRQRSPEGAGWEA
ncbi:MAG TPA: MFS transporter [Candidatus Limnocylindrales bacterium]